MGTDIHSIAQVHKPATRFNQLDVSEQPPTLPDVWQTTAIGIDGDPRSYNTFAMLADVRNGHGFAGVKTSDGFPVIHAPRSLPDDLVVENNYVPVVVADLVAAWDWNGKLVDINDKEARRVFYLNEDDSTMWLGEHSHSWCTLTELKTFVDNVASKFEACIHGVVDMTEYKTAKAENREFNSWSGDVWGHGVVVVDENQVDLVDNATHVRVSWTRNALENSRLPKIVAALEIVAQRCGVTDDNVRFVYGFDS
jgi:hypothetical protein